MNAIERIFQFIEYKGISVSEFSKTIQVSNGYLAKQKSASANIGSHIIEKIVINYPEISTDWIITGRGNMLINSKDTILQNQNTHISKQKEKKNFQSATSIENTCEVDKTYQCNGINDIVIKLIERLNEQAEEIGALRQENISLKHRLTQAVEDVKNVKNVPA